MQRSLRTAGFVALFCVSVSPSMADAQRPPLEGLDDFIRESMRIWNVPGVAVAIVKDDSVVFAKGFGVRQVGRSALVDEHTIFPIASNTKALSAALVAMGVDEGKLAWNDPITEHVPGFVQPDRWKPDLRLRELLSFQTSGRFLYQGSGEGYGAAMRMLLTALGELSAPCESPECTSTGDRVALRTAFQRFFRARLVGPLGLTSISMGAELWDPDDVRACTECELEGRTVDIGESRADNITMLHILDTDGPRPIAWLGSEGGIAGGWGVGPFLGLWTGLVADGLPGSARGRARRH